MSPNIVVLGAGFAGLTVAADLRQRLGPRPNITVISKEEEFLFVPSLIWVPFGLRKREDISFNTQDVLEEHDVAFKKAAVLRLDLENRELHLNVGRERFDFLVLATGLKADFDAIPGLGPRGHTHSIYSWSDAAETGDAFERLLTQPGPIVIGAAQGVSFLLPAYEFVLNLARQLRTRLPHQHVPMTFVTPEPYVGHLGLGSVGTSKRDIRQLFDDYRIDVITETSLREARARELVLEDGRALPFSFAMIAPPCVGIAPIRECRSIVDDRGFVVVKPTYQVEGVSHVYAAGACVAIQPAEETKIPLGFPTSGFVAEEMARVVAHNIACEMEGGEPIHLLPSEMSASWILDAGNTGIFLSVDHRAHPHEHARLKLSPYGHWAKVVSEKYFLATRRMGFLS